MNKNNNVFEDFKINVRIKLAALWTSVMFCYIYGDYFELYVPKKVEGLLNGHDILNNPMKLKKVFLFAIIVITIITSRLIG